MRVYAPRFCGAAILSLLIPNFLSILNTEEITIYPTNFKLLELLEPGDLRASKLIAN